MRNPHPGPPPNESQRTLTFQQRARVQTKSEAATCTERVSPLVHRPENKQGRTRTACHHHTILQSPPKMCSAAPPAKTPEPAEQADGALSAAGGKPSSQSFREACVVPTGARLFLGGRGSDGRGVNRVPITPVPLLLPSECTFRVSGRVRVFKEIPSPAHLFTRSDCLAKASFGMLCVMMCTC